MLQRRTLPLPPPQILRTAEGMAEQGWVYTIEASFLEVRPLVMRGRLMPPLPSSILFPPCQIYNEAIRDLLRVTPPRAAAGGASSGPAPPPPPDVPATLTVHQDGEGAVEVPGLTRLRVPDAAAVDALLARAAKKRAVAATSMNEVSSRRCV